MWSEVYYTAAARTKLAGENLAKLINLHPDCSLHLSSDQNNFILFKNFEQSCNCTFSKIIFIVKVPLNTSHIFTYSSIASPVH